MDPHQFIRESCQRQARKQAELLDQEIRVWLRMGYALPELRLVWRRTGLTFATEVWPESMLPATC